MGPEGRANEGRKKIPIIQDGPQYTKRTQDLASTVLVRCVDFVGNRWEGGGRPGRVGIQKKIKSDNFLGATTWEVFRRTKFRRKIFGSVNICSNSNSVLIPPSLTR